MRGVDFDERRGVIKPHAVMRNRAVMFLIMTKRMMRERIAAFASGDHADRNIAERRMMNGMIRGQLLARRTIERRYREGASTLCFSTKSATSLP